MSTIELSQYDLIELSPLELSETEGGIGFFGILAIGIAISAVGNFISDVETLLTHGPFNPG